MKRLLGLLGLVCLGSSLAACTEDSADLATNEIEATYHAEHIDGKLHVTATLRTGDAFNYVDLTGGDTLTASSEKGPLPPFEPNPIDSTIHSIDADGDFDQVSIAFNRTSQTSAPASVVELPEHYALTAPVGDVSYADGSVTFEWSNQIEGARVAYFDEPCGAISAGVTNDISADTGSLTIAISSLVSEAPGAAGECVTVTLVRLVDGKVDPAFLPTSKFDARRDDDFDITIVP